jgi:4'-phosphopantetheinyl transferase
LAGADPETSECVADQRGDSMMTHCDVWVASPVLFDPEALGALNRDERERHVAYARDADRDRFATGAVLLRRVIGSMTGVHPAAVLVDRVCPDCGRPHGKPRVPGGYELSVSHSGGKVLLAVCTGVAVGVDVERIDPALDLAEVAAEALSPHELAVLSGIDPVRQAAGFARYWARKEALVKATGDGLPSGLAAITVAPPDQPAAVLGWYGGPAELIDLDVGSGYAAALAILTASPRPVRLLDANIHLSPEPSMRFG